MNKTLRNILVGATILGSIASVGCNNQKETITTTVANSAKTEIYNWVQGPKTNQKTSSAPLMWRGAYMGGVTDVLTDIDGDGSWDAHEQHRHGFTAQSGSFNYYEIDIKKGYEFPDSLISQPEVRIVPAEYFARYDERVK